MYSCIYNNNKTFFYCTNNSRMPRENNTQQSSTITYNNIIIIVVIIIIMNEFEELKSATRVVETISINKFVLGGSERARACKL